MNNPIPKQLRTQFIEHMKAHDIDDMPDGAWFAILETAARQFMDSNKLTKPWMCENDATHWYLSQIGGAA